MLCDFVWNASYNTKVRLIMSFKMEGSCAQSKTNYKLYFHDNNWWGFYD